MHVLCQKDPPHGTSSALNTALEQAGHLLISSEPVEDTAVFIVLSGCVTDGIQINWTENLMANFADTNEPVFEHIRLASDCAR